MFSQTRPLLGAVRSALPERPFHLVLWDGSRLDATARDGGAPTFTVRSPQALAHVLRAPGQLGIGRAYVSGLLEPDDLDAALAVVTGWSPPPLSRGERARLGVGLALAVGITRPPAIPEMEIRQQGVLHSIRRDKEAVAFHYNSGNAFFQTFLDPSMTYSCAIFSRGAQTLEAAQETKLELVCTKLALQPGQRVLDVGCGWGAFAIHAARHHDVSVLGITISEEQAELARQKVDEAGVADRVEIRLADYRELHEEPFDAISSIGMVEHVGEARIDAYAATLHRQLKPGGRLLNHGIAQLMTGEFTEPGPFNERYVFPDGETLPVSRVQLALERAGFIVEHVENFQHDYAETLRHWIRRYDENYAQAERLVGPERARVWRLYLRAARRGFENDFTGVYQVRCTRP